MTPKDIWDMLKESWHEWNKDKATRLGATLAYYTLFSLAPLEVYAHRHGSRAAQPAAQRRTLAAGQPRFRPLEHPPVPLATALAAPACLDATRVHGHWGVVAAGSLYRPLMLVAGAVVLGLLVFGARRRARYL